MALLQDDLLKSFYWWVDPKTRTLIYTRYGYKYTLYINSSRVTIYLRDKHGIIITARQGLIGILRSFRLYNADEVPYRRDSILEYLILYVYEGFSCS